ncbi:MAG: MCE family protein [Burkholderiales bacterium]|nr:MCE family protein [Phycisphaerae bacterium]
MSTYRRNVAVGATVLIALAILGWMIIRFGGQIATPFAAKTMVVSFITNRADGVSDGSAVMFRGISVGRVIKVRRDANLKDIWFDAEIEVAPPLPGDITANIRQASLLGSGSRIELQPSETSDGSTLKPGQTITATYTGLDIFPPEVRNLSVELAATAKQFREANVIASFNKRLDEIGKVLDEAHVTMLNLNKVVGDPKFSADLRTTLDNIRIASDNVKSVTGRADRLVEGLEGAVQNVNKTVSNADAQLTDLGKLTRARLEEAARITQQTNEIIAKINDGQGTAGKLVNDPKLYEGLVGTTEELNATIKDLQRLVRQWEQEGVSLKLR